MSGWERVTNLIPRVAAAAVCSRFVPKRDIEFFAEIAEDRNPLRYDRQIAEASVFGGPIVQGGVASGIPSAVAAEDLPGPGTVSLAEKRKFMKGVLVGDEITGGVEVMNVRTDKPICVLETSVRNHKGEICLSGQAAMYTAPMCKQE